MARFWIASLGVVALLLAAPAYAGHRSDSFGISFYDPDSGFSLALGSNGYGDYVRVGHDGYRGRYYDDRRHRHYRHERRHRYYDGYRDRNYSRYRYDDRRYYRDRYYRDAYYDDYRYDRRHHHDRYCRH